MAAPDARWGEIPVAVVVLHPGATATQEELLAFAGQRVARFKLPRQCTFQAEPLPKGGTGKVLKYVLREQFWTSKDKRIQG